MDCMPINYDLSVLAKVHVQIVFFFIFFYLRQSDYSCTLVPFQVCFTLIFFNTQIAFFSSETAIAGNA